MEKRTKKQTVVIVGVILLVVIAAVTAGIFLSKGKAETDAVPLTADWSSDSAAARSLRDYVAQVTDPGNTDGFIPEEDRIAVFDMDGTLTCETYYTYYDTMMFIEYCLVDHESPVDQPPELED